MTPEINPEENLKWYEKGFWKWFFIVGNTILSIIIINEILLHIMHKDDEK